MSKEFFIPQVPRSERVRAGLIPEFMLKHFGWEQSPARTFLDIRALAGNVIDICLEDNGEGAPRLIDGVLYSTASDVVLRRHLRKSTMAGPGPRRAVTKEFVEIWNLRKLQVMAGRNAYDRVRIVRSTRDEGYLLQKPVEYLPRPGIRIDSFLRNENESPDFTLASVGAASVMPIEGMSILQDVRTTLAIAEITAASPLILADNPTSTTEQAY